MTIGEILAKSNPLQPQKETSQSEYKKLVDTNTKLIDKMKYQEEEIEELKIKYNIMKENAETLAKRIDKAIENINKYERIHGINYMFENEDFKEELLNILKGENE